MARGKFASINPSEYASMNNVFLDVHYYNWLSGYSTSVSANATALQAEVKTSQAAYGGFPVIIGEFGTSTTGDGTDPGGMATVSAVTQSPYGWTAWGSTPAALGDQLTNGGNGLTASAKRWQQRQPRHRPPCASRSRQLAAATPTIAGRLARYLARTGVVAGRQHDHHARHRHAGKHDRRQSVNTNSLTLIMVLAVFSGTGALACNPNNPVDLSCPPTIFLDRTFGSVSYYMNNGPARFAELTACTHPVPWYS